MDTRGSIINVVIILIIILFMGMAGYLVLTSKSPTPVQTVVPIEYPTATTTTSVTTTIVNGAPKKVTRSSLVIVPAPFADKSLTLYSSFIEEYAEGYDTVHYTFKYPAPAFSLETSADHKLITFTELATGKTNTLNITYEGRNGIASDDYWANTLSYACSTCAQVANPVTIKNAMGLMTFADTKHEWIVFSSPVTARWLFVVELQKPATAIEKILSTFTFVQTP